MKTTFKIAAIAALFGSLSTISLSAAAQDKIVLRVADYLPPSHYLIRFVAKHWIETVTKQSNGRVEIKHFPSEQLGKAKDLLSLAQSGVADISGIVPGFVSDRMPLGTFAELPGLYNSSCQGTAAAGELLLSGGILAKEELEPNNVVAILTIATVPYNLFSRRDRLATLGDVKGLKIRTLGGVMSDTVDKLGGVGVQMASPEIYESLSRGTVEGIAYTYSALASNGFHKLVKSSMTGINFGGSTFAYLMSKQKWNSLPPDIQKILLSAGQETMEFACREIDKDEQAAKLKVKEAGVQFFEPQPADVTKMNQIKEEVAAGWIREASRRGAPAEAVYKGFRAALAKSGAK